MMTHDIATQVRIERDAILMLLSNSPDAKESAQACYQLCEKTLDDANILALTLTKQIVEQTPKAYRTQVINKLKTLRFYTP